jgi:hypothetical protein
MDFAARDTPYRHPSDGEKELFGFVRLTGPMVRTKAVSL